jgi:epoxyqueuosine reductase
MASLAGQIKERAVEIGFQKVGIVPAVPLDAEGDRLKEWLERGFHGEMTWMEREPDKRTNPQVLFPGAKSIIVGVINYYTPHLHPEKIEQGKISRYAWGDDYHDVVREKLKELLAWIKTVEPGVDGKICVDTAPLMDKAWAARAGLGWIGKHSNLITKEVGSWVFIGSLLLDIELEYDAQVIDDHCGTCTACIDACPTSAISEPYVVDSRKCISYATIELRSDELPAEIASNLDGWIYGCDICQEICPWNRFEQPTTEARFEPRHGETSVELETVLSWTPEEYAERFRRSAIKRAKLRGLKRNAAHLKKSD